MRINSTTKIELFKKMGNSFCQTIFLCNCFNSKIYDYNDEHVYFEPEYCKKSEDLHFKHYPLVEDKIFTITNESFSFESLNDTKINMESKLLNTRQIFIDISPKELINDSISLDSGFSSRNMSPNHTVYPIESIVPNFTTPVLNCENSSSSMANFYDFLTSTQSIFFETSLATNSFPIMIKNKFFERSTSTIDRVKQTAMKILFFKSSNKNFIRSTPKNIKETYTSKLISLIKKPFSIFGILASGLSLLKLALKQHKQDDEEMLLEPRYSYSPFRQFLIRIYDINFF